jgi:hypothetical protein
LTAIPHTLQWGQTALAVAMENKRTLVTQYLTKKMAEHANTRRNSEPNDNSVLSVGDQRGEASLGSELYDDSIEMDSLLGQTQVTVHCSVAEREMRCTRTSKVRKNKKYSMGASNFMSFYNF